MTTTQKRIEEKQAYIAGCQEAIDNLTELIQALENVKGVSVDRRFFEQYFTLNNGYRDYTKYSIQPVTDSWKQYSHTLYVSKDCTLELKARNKNHILEVAREALEQKKAYLKETKESIVLLESFNEQALIDDIRALYVKHGKPETWYLILKSFDVTNPEYRQ